MGLIKYTEGGRGEEAKIPYEITRYRARCIARRCICSFAGVSGMKIN